MSTSNSQSMSKPIIEVNKSIQLCLLSAMFQAPVNGIQVILKAYMSV